jgi:hypothetical protein
MKNRHRVSQVVSKAYLLRGGRRKILKQCGLLSILFDPKFRQLELLRDVGIYFIRKNLNGFGEPRHMPRLRDLPSSHPSSQEASGRLPLCHERSGAPSRR